MNSNTKNKLQKLSLLSIFSLLVIPSLVSASRLSEEPKGAEGIVCEKVETNEVPELGKPAYTPKDQYYSNQSVAYDHLGDIETVWNYYQGEGLTVAVIDSGLDYDHPDFYDEDGNSRVRLSDGMYITHVTQESGGPDYSWTTTDSTGILIRFPVVNGYRYIDNVKYTGAEIIKHNGATSHGTSVAGTVAAYNHQNTKVGTIGIAPKAKIVPIKTDFYTDSIGEGLKYIYELNTDNDSNNDIDVVNISIESSSTWQTITTYAQYLRNIGTIVVASAGNGSTDTATYPAANPNIIGVGALADDSSTQLASYSNFNSNYATASTSTNNTEIVAPGQVYAPTFSSNSHSYTLIHGTSFASPLTAGAAALWKEAHPNGSVNDFKDDLHESCADIGGSGWDRYFGYGALNVAELLKGPAEIVVNNPEIDEGYLDLEAGDTLDLDITVNGIGSFSDAVTYTLDSNDGTISVDANGHITALNAGEEMITIASVENPSITEVVFVTVTGSIVTKVLTSITLEGQTTSYWVNDSFSFDGICTAHYSDETSQVVAPTSVSSPSMSTSGNKTVTVSYSENDITQNAYYDITVNAWILSSIEITTPATKTTFSLNDTFSSGGLVVTAHYTNGQSKVVTPVVTAPDMTSEGNKTVNVSYTEGGIQKTTSYTINVIAYTTTGTMAFSNATGVTSELDGSVWTASNCSYTSYLNMNNASSKIESSLMDVDTSVDAELQISARYNGGSGPYISITAVNENNVSVITNALTISPTTNSKKTYTVKLSFNSTVASQVKFKIQGNMASTRFVGVFDITLTYKSLPIVSSFSLDNTAFDFDLYGVKSGTITPTVVADPGVDTTVTYTLSANNIVSLSKYSTTKDETITVTALAVGSVTITARCGNKVADCNVTVIDTTPIPITSLTISQTELDLTEGNDATLSTTILPSNATNKNLTWSTSDASIVSISSTSGSSITIHAQLNQYGKKATITVSTTDGSQISRTCEVSVIEKVKLSYIEFEDLPTLKFASEFTSSDMANTKVKAHFTDGSSAYVTNQVSIDTSAVNTNVLGKHPVSTSYTFDGIQKEVTDYVTVSNYGATSIGIDTYVEEEVQSTKNITGNFGDGFTTGKAGNQYQSGRGVQVTDSCNTAAKAAYATTDETYEKVTSIVVTYSTNASNGAGSIAFQVGTNTAVSKTVTKTGGTTDRTMAYSFSGEQNGKVKISIICTTNSIYVKKFVVTHTVTSGVSYDATPTEQAEAWSNYFLAELNPLCAADGNTSAENLALIESKWTLFKNEYNWMVPESKAEFVNNPTGNVQIAKAQQIYDLIVNKYHYEAFVTDGNSNQLYSIPNNGIICDNTIVIAVVLIASASIVLGSYFIIKRKRAK